VTSSEEDAVAEELEAGAPVHLPFDHFRLVVDAFRSPVVVREGDCGGGGLARSSSMTLNLRRVWS
jgi:hypothetical protein